MILITKVCSTRPPLIALTARPTRLLARRHRSPSRLRETRASKTWLMVSPRKGLTQLELFRANRGGLREESQWDCALLTGRR